MNFNKKQIILIMVTVAMICVFFFMQYIPTVKAIEQAKKEKQQKLSEQAKVQDQLEKLPQLQKQLNRLKTQIGNFDSRIPAQRNLGGFLHEVTEMMNNHSLANQMVRPGTEKKYKKITVIPIDIECTGSLKQIFEFFKDIQNKQRLFSLENIKFENKDFSGNIKIYAKGNVFYRQEK